MISLTDPPSDHLLQLSTNKLKAMTRLANGNVSSICQIALPIICTTVLSINPAQASPSIWVKCGKAYIIGLNERDKTYTLNDDSFIRDGKLQVTGRWFHGKAAFAPYKVEFTYAEAFHHRGTGVIIENRFEISRIDLHYQRYVRKKLEIANGRQKAQDTIRQGCA